MESPCRHRQLMPGVSWHSFFALFLASVCTAQLSPCLTWQRIAADLAAMMQNDCACRHASWQPPELLQVRHPFLFCTSLTRATAAAHSSGAGAPTATPAPAADVAGVRSAAQAAATGRKDQAAPDGAAAQEDSLGDGFSGASDLSADAAAPASTAAAGADNAAFMSKLQVRGKRSKKAASSNVASNCPGGLFKSAVDS